MKTIPQLGFWTRQLNDELCSSLVKEALVSEYRHIDTAQIYANEQEVGSGWHSSDIPREEIRITTKIRTQNYGNLLSSFEQSLQKLQTDYVDLLLLHRPTNLKQHEQCFDALLHLKQQGKIREFGVSNFTLAQLKHAWEYTQGQIFTNQIEYHISLSQDTLKSYMDEKEILLTAYSPLGHGNLLKDPTIQSLAKKHQVSAAQICITWLLQQWCIVIPKASSLERIQENLQAQDITLDEEDLEVIAGLPKNHRYISPPFAPERDQD